MAARYEIFCANVADGHTPWLAPQLAITEHIAERALAGQAGQTVWWAVELVRASSWSHRFGQRRSSLRQFAAPAPDLYDVHPSW